MGFCPLLSGITFDSAGTYISLQKIDCQGSDCEWWNSITGKCSVIDIDDYQRHFDQEHWNKTGASVPKASVLVSEYMGNQDLDGNGLVYGFDFYITEDDTIPKMLLKIQQTSDFDKTGLTEMTWQQYLDSL